MAYLQLMKYILLLLLPLQLFATDYQITKDTTINNTWTLKQVDRLIFTDRGYIHGTGTISGCQIIANNYQRIFDTTLTVNTSYLSAAWYGQIQKSVNLASVVFIPAGNWRQPSITVGDGWRQKYIEIYGERGTTITCIGKGPALNLQIAKDSRVHDLAIAGSWTPPPCDSNYYKIPINQFGADSSYGLTIDYYGDRSTSGSSRVVVTDVYVTGFTYLFAISPNRRTQNADDLEFTRCRGGNGRIMFSGGQAQEKANRINAPECWGSLAVFLSLGKQGKKQAGQWTVNGGSFAGQVRQLFDWDLGYWYTTHVTDLYAEKLWSIGTIWSTKGLPVSLDKLTLQFIPGDRKLIDVVGPVSCSGCIIRKYGTTEPLRLGTLSVTGELSGELKRD